MRTHLYRITIAGRLGALGREVFAGLDITSDGPATVLDQAALYSVLNRNPGSWLGTGRCDPAG